MKQWLLLISLVFASVIATAAPRTEVSFDNAWRFKQGDIAGAESPALDDNSWVTVNTPHDWAIAGPFDEHAPTGGAGGFLPTGVAWYRKHFNLDANDKGRRVFVEFDGVMEKSGVWINGVHLGHRPNGYSSFRYELTPHLRFGSGEQNANIIAVRSDNEAQPASRWYAGAGIYRHVRLITTNDVHVDQWGTFVTTPQIAKDRATVRVESTVINQSRQDRTAHLQITLTDPDGETVLQARGDALVIPAGRTTQFTIESSLKDPRRWDIADPALYRATVSVVAGDGTTLDEDNVTFGVREAKFEAATGFWLNGRNIKLKGVALHADAGALGMAAPLSF